MERIPINPELKNCYVGYVITNSENNVISANIEHYTQLLTINTHTPVHINIIMQNEDRLKLYNNFKKWCMDNKYNSVFQVNVRELLEKDCRVLCVTTGEIFKNPSAASQQHELSYPQLHKHLKKHVGYKTVKGKTYKYVAPQ